MILPRMITPLSVKDARAALSQAYVDVVGREPTTNVLALLMAQSSLETARWRAMQRWNFGMVKGSDAYPTNVLLRDDCGENECLFRAYADMGSGARDYIRILKARQHWWTGLHSGTASGFNEGLTTAPRYYTSPNTTGYENTLRIRAKEFGSSDSGGGGGGGSSTALWVVLLLGVGIAYRKRRK